MTTLVLMLIAFQLKHFICDYLLQIQYMLGKMKENGWVLPLASHALVHALGTAGLIWYFTQELWLTVGLAILDFILHFVIDRIKASPKLLGRFNPQQSRFWWVLGLDQMMHHLVHYFIIVTAFTRGAYW